MDTDRIARVRQSVDLVRLIQQSGFTIQNRGAGKLTTKEHDSLIIDPRRGVYNWYSQDEWGDAIDWVQRREGVDLEAALEILEGKGFHRRTPAEGRSKASATTVATTAPPLLPQDLHLRYHFALDDTARAWWHSQGITDAGITRFFLGVCDDHEVYGRAYTIPVIEGDVLVNLRMRLDNPSKPGDKYRPWAAGYGTQLFNADILTPEIGDVIIVAGEKKVIVLWEYGFPAVSPTGGCSNWKPEWTTRLRFCRRVYVCFDPAEVKPAEKLAAQIGDRAYLVRCTDKPDDLIIREGREAFRACLAQARPYVDRDYWRSRARTPLYGRLLV